MCRHRPTRGRRRAEQRRSPSAEDRADAEAGAASAERPTTLGHDEDRAQKNAANTVIHPYWAGWVKSDRTTADAHHGRRHTEEDRSGLERQRDPATRSGQGLRSRLRPLGPRPQRSVHPQADTHPGNDVEECDCLQEKRRPWGSRVMGGTEALDEARRDPRNDEPRRASLGHPEPKATGSGSRGGATPSGRAGRGRSRRRGAGRTQPVLDRGSQQRERTEGIRPSAAAPGDGRATRAAVTGAAGTGGPTVAPATGRAGRSGGGRHGAEDDRSEATKGVRNTTARRSMVRHDTSCRGTTKCPEGTAVGPLMQSLVPLAAPSGQPENSQRSRDPSIPLFHEVRTATPGYPHPVPSDRDAGAGVRYD